MKCTACNLSGLQAWFVGTAEREAARGTQRLEVPIISAFHTFTILDTMIYISGHES